MKFTKQIADYLAQQRWCNFKEEIRLHQIKDFNFEGISFDDGSKILGIGEITQKDGEKRYFMMPLQKAPKETVNALKMRGKTYTDALQQQDYWQKLMQLFKENSGVLFFANGWKLQHRIMHNAEILAENADSLSKPLGVEQSNTTLKVGDEAIAFKQERILDFSQKPNPEFTMNEKLMREGCSVMPKTYSGFLMYNTDGEVASAGIVQEFVPNKGDLWNYSLKYLKEKLAAGYLIKRKLYPEDHPDFMYLMRDLSKKTAEMSECLSRPDTDAGFTPELVDDRFIYIYKNQMTVLLYQTHRSIKNNLEKLPEPTKRKAAILLADWEPLTQSYVNDKLQLIAESPNKGFVTRVHGDFHLGQVMVTKDNDLRFIDFAGEPDLPLTERDKKHISVRDVAGMYRSIKGYLGAVAVEEFASEAPDAATEAERKKYASEAVKPLIDEATHAFLGRYSIQEPWLGLEILRKNLYEVNYEVNNRPQMAYVAIDGLADMLMQKNNVSERQKNNSR